MRVVLITVCGRKKFLKIQRPYIESLKHVVDEHHLWVNTENPEDLAYLEEMQKSDPDHFKLIRRPTFLHDRFDENGSPSVHSVGQMISPFFKNCVEQDTVYVRIDDDVCFIEVDVFQSYVDFRVAHPEYFLVFPVIVNNCMDFRVFPRSHPFCQSGYEEETDWRPHGGQIGLHLHNCFFSNPLSSLKFENDGVRGCGEMAAINCISWLGSEFAKFDGMVAWNKDHYEQEEEWLIRDKPNQIGKQNCIFGGMVVCHYSFAHQRAPYHTYFGDGLDLDTTDVLERYEFLSLEHMAGVKRFDEIPLSHGNQERITLL